MSTFNCPTCDKIAELTPGHQSIQDQLSRLSTREFVIQCLVKAGLCLCPVLRAHHNKEVPRVQS